MVWQEINELGEETGSMEAADAVSRSEVGCWNRDWTQALRTPRGGKPLGGLVGWQPWGCSLSVLRVFSQQLWPGWIPESSSSHSVWYR